MLKLFNIWLYETLIYFQKYLVNFKLYRRWLNQTILSEFVHFTTKKIKNENISLKILNFEISYNQLFRLISYIYNLPPKPEDPNPPIL